MEWQMKPSTWDLDLLQQAGNDNLAMRSSSLQIHNGQWSLQDGDHGSAAVYTAGLMGTNHNRNHDSNHMIGASQNVLQFPRPSSSGTTTTNTSRDSGSSSGLPAGSAADCSNGNRQAAAFPAKDPAKLRNGWLYRGSGELPKVASGLNTAGNGTNHTNNGTNQSNYSSNQQQQQGHNSSSDRSGAQLISANGGGGGGDNNNFASKRTYPKEDGVMNQNEGALAATVTASTSAYKKHRNTGSGGAVHMPRCQVDGCKEDLGKAKKDYHRRHKVCEMHSKAPKVITSGFEQRFCQQCSRFHAISEFDDAKRSCRRRLAGHNERRRKSSQDTAALSLASMFQDDRRHLNYYMQQHPLAMPLSFPIYQNEDTARRSRVIELEEQVAMVCRAQCAMNGGTLPSYAANRLLSILHAYKGSSSSSTHDVLEYSNTNNHNNNDNPSMGEGLTLCSNSVGINGSSQPSSGPTSMLAASLEAASQQLGLLDSGRALSLLSSGGGQPLRNSTHHQASLDPEILNHHIITSSNQSLNANPTHHGHHHHQDQYQANNHSALIPLSTDNDYHLKDPKLFTDSPRNLALSIGMSPAGGNVDQSMMASNHNDILEVGINNGQRFATSSAHGVATDFSQHLHPLRVYENSLFTAHANMQSHV